jgi:hypothetical protein
LTSAIKAFQPTPTSSASARRVFKPPLIWQAQSMPMALVLGRTVRLAL